MAYCPAQRHMQQKPPTTGISRLHIHCWTHDKLGSWQMTGDTLAQGLLPSLQSAGLSCVERFRLGLMEAALYGCKKVRWCLLLPYRLHCYLFLAPAGVQPDAPHVLGLNSLARGFTDRFKNRRSRYFRWTVPITITLIFSEKGFSEDAVAEVSTRKQRYQMGDVNVVILLDGSKMSVHRLARFGFIGSLPLKRVHKLVCALLSHVGFQDASS